MRVTSSIQNRSIIRFQKIQLLLFSKYTLLSHLISFLHIIFSHQTTTLLVPSCLLRGLYISDELPTVC